MYSQYCLESAFSHDMFVRLALAERTSIERELAKRNAAYTSTMEGEQEIMSEFHSLIEAAQVTRKALDALTGEEASPTLVYSKHEAGEHSLVTE